MERSKRKLNTLSKIIEVLMKIAKVFTIIGIVGIAVSMILVGFVFSKIKINGDEIKIKGAKEKIVILDDAIKVGDKVISEGSIKDDIKEIRKVLNENSKSKLTLYVELSLLFTAIYLVILCFIYSLVIKIFKNIRTISPFKEENITYTRKIGYYLIAIFVLGLISSIVLGMLFTNPKFSINVPSIIGILFVFVLSYVIEYGNKLETKNEKSE